MVGIPALIEWVQLASTRLLLLLLGVSIHHLQEVRSVGGSASRFENRKHSTWCTCMFGHTSLNRTATEESTNLDEVEFTLEQWSYLQLGDPQIYLGPSSKHGT